MATKGEKNVGLTLAAAGAGIIGASVVFGLTTEGGAIDWVGIVTGDRRLDHDRVGSVQSVPSRHTARWLSWGPAGHLGVGVGRAGLEPATDGL